MEIADFSDISPDLTPLNYTNFNIIGGRDLSQSEIENYFASILEPEEQILSVSEESFDHIEALGSDDHIEALGSDDPNKALGSDDHIEALGSDDPNKALEPALTLSINDMVINMAEGGAEDITDYKSYLEPPQINSGISPHFNGGIYDFVVCDDIDLNISQYIHT